ncbi:ABC transporter permease [Prevotella stercorea]|uniref:ABC transporter permease n=1 Tax=Leyella stercorea TaxID=363265 RepID=UPI001F2E8D50|nr:FtsX-like permease family protein [Leyella stercorea]MCF2644559.1 ABC transporter permease [Leyella stercorea]MCF2644568.1 ABC transporter permease [Leyella stercorea]
MNFPLFIARRIYSDHIGDQQKVSKPAIRIAVAGVAIGLAVMIISVCVVLGFKHTIRDKVVGFGSHIQVANFYTLQSSAIDQPIAIGDSMMNVLKRTDGVKHVQRFAMKQGILKTDNDFLGVMFKGVGPEFDSTFIHKSMVEGSIPHFSDQQSTNRILISKDMASKLRVKAGDRIFAYFIGEGGVRTRRFTISGVYQTNLAQYDKTTCFCDLYTARKLNAWTDDMVTGAELTVNDFKQLGTTANDIINRVNRTQDQYGNTFSSKTIRELSPQIFSWLDLLDLNVWIILAIMTAVAVVTMISGLLIIILERTTMIGVLKALGARNSTVRHTFLWFAAFIIGKGLLIGDALALVLILLQKLTGFAKLDPQTYYVDVVPVELDWTLIVALNIATMLIALFVLIAPSYLVSHIHPAKSMRYE